MEVETGGCYEERMDGGWMMYMEKWKFGGRGDF